MSVFTCVYALHIIQPRASQLGEGSPPQIDWKLEGLGFRVQGLEIMSFCRGWGNGLGFWAKGLGSFGFGFQSI